MNWLEQLVKDSPIVTSFVGASLATCVPLVFNLIKDVVFDYRKRKAEREFIGVQLIFILENFVSKCADISWDKGYDNEYPEEGDNLTDQVKIENFDMSSVKGEYKYLKPKFLYKLHSINIQIYQAHQKLYRSKLDCWHLKGSLDWEYYEMRRELFADIGLYVADIANKLRKEFKIQRVKGWKPEKRIIRSKNQIKEEKLERKKKIKERKEKQRLNEIEDSNR